MMFDMIDMILPAPDPAFVWRHTASGPALECLPLSQIASHLFTTRQWALGRDRPLGSVYALDDLWTEVAQAIGVPLEMLVRMQQVHGSRTAQASARLDPPVADILLNDDPEIAIAVQAADCAPVLMADRRTGAVAAAHAGWRGLVARVPAGTVEALARTFGSRPDDLIVAAGPSIGSCCYEVGREVRDAFSAAGFSSDALGRWFLDRPDVSAGNPPRSGLLSGRPDHWFFDGWRVVREQLEEAGVAPGHIHSSGLCTSSHSGAFCSYRRDGVRAGRMAGAIRTASTARDVPPCC